MIRNLLATTAIAAFVATGAMAQTTTAPTTTDPGMAAPAQPEQPKVKHAEGHLASELLGMSVYNGTSDDAQNIGKVSDLVLDKGQVKAIVVGVGGFLGIGQKDVALEYNLVEWAKRDDGDEWLVVETTADALKAQPEFDAAAYKPMPADADVSETKPATKEDLANAPKPEAGATDDQGTAATDEGTAGADTSTTATDNQSPAIDNTDTGATTGDTTTGATTGDQTDSSATGTDAEKPAMDSGTDTGTDMPKDDTAQ